VILDVEVVGLDGDVEDSHRGHTHPAYETQDAEDPAHHTDGDAARQ
jgi:hypothetical protein